MYSITFPGEHELILLHSKAGTLRGGHSHTVPEHVLVLSGRMLYHRLTETGKEQVEELLDGTASFNPAGAVHMGEFPEDTWVLEYKLARKGEWSNVNYPAWREKVNASSGS